MKPLTASQSGFQVLNHLLIHSFLHFDKLFLSTVVLGVGFLTANSTQIIFSNCSKSSQ